MKTLSPLASVIKHVATYVVLLGLLLIGFGIAIALYPEIITLLVVSFFLFMGFVSLVFGFNMMFFYNKAAKALNKIRIDWFWVIRYSTGIVRRISCENE